MGTEGTDDVGNGAAQGDTGVEARAAKMGWVPESEWRGDAKAWRPAEEFVERGENYVPILRDRLAKVEADLATAIKMNTSAVARADKDGYDRAKAEYDAKRTALKDDQFKAVQEGDQDKFRAADAALDELKEPEKAAAPAPPTEANPIFEEWRGANLWYGADVELTEYAEFVASRAVQDGSVPGGDMKAFYGAVEKKVRATFPQKFQNVARSGAARVAGGGSGESGAGKSWSDLPEVAKAAFGRLKRRYENQGKKIDKKEYVKTYFED